MTYGHTYFPWCYICVLALVLMGCEPEDDLLGADGGITESTFGPLCEVNEDCASEEACESGACARQSDSDENLRYLRFGSGGVNTSGTAQLTVPVPAGATSFAVVLDGSGDADVLASRIESPSGDIVFDMNDSSSKNFSEQHILPYTVVVPNHPSVGMEAGDWHLSLLASENVNVNATVVIQTAQRATQTLEVRIILVLSDEASLDATSAAENADFQSLLSGVTDVFFQAGIEFSVVEYVGVDAEQATEYGVLDSIDGENSELAQLLRLGGDSDSRVLNVFFVEDIAVGSGRTRIAGVSGGTPGPPTINGTGRSGVAINLGSFLADPTDVDATVITIAHEAAHYLGLYHSSEKSGGGDDAEGFDHLADTPQCGIANDENGDELLSVQECSDADGFNLMFWTAASAPIDNIRLTDDQSAVLRMNPIVH